MGASTGSVSVNGVFVLLPYTELDDAITTRDTPARAASSRITLVPSTFTRA